MATAIVFCTLIGLVLIAAGAALAASALTITEEQLQEMTSTADWGRNERLMERFKSQSLRARWGLACICVGSVLQLVGTLLSLS